MAEKRKTIRDEPGTKKPKIEDAGISSEVQRLLKIKAKLQAITHTPQQENAQHSTPEDLLEHVLAEIGVLNDKLQKTIRNNEENRQKVKLLRYACDNYSSNVASYYAEALEENIKHFPDDVEDMAKLQNVLDLGPRPLYIACKRGDLRVVDLVLQKGAIKRSRECFAVNLSPMHLVCEKHSESKAYDLMRMLLQANVYSLAHARRDSKADKTTDLDCLQVAIMRKLASVVWLLVNEGLWIFETCEVNSVCKTVWELCEGDEATRNSLLQFWTPTNHRLHEKHVRNNVRLVLLISKRNKWNLDASIMHLILSFVAYEASWIVETDAKLVRPLTPKDQYFWVKSANSDTKVRWKLDVKKSNLGEESEDEENEDNEEEEEEEDDNEEAEENNEEDGNEDSEDEQTEAVLGCA